MSQQTIKLMEILKGLHIYVDGDATAYIDDSDYEEALQAILKLIKEMVPEKQVYQSDPLGGPDDAEDVAAVYGFDKCRKTFLDRLEEMEKQ